MSDRKLETRARRLVGRLLASTCVVAAGAACAQSSLPKPTGDAQEATPVAGAVASGASSARTASTAAEIQRINERLALLQAQLNELELQARISTKRREIQGAATSAGPDSAFHSTAGVPAVLSVAGRMGRLEAVLVFPGGVTQRVKAGDVIHDRRVAKVSLNEVVLTDLHGRKAQRLAFGSAPAVRELSPSYAPPPPVLPLPSPVMGR